MYAVRPRPSRTLANIGCLWLGLDLMFLIFLIIGGWIGYGSWRLVQGGKTAPGEVVDMVASNSDGGTTYAPVIEYVVQGDTYRFESHNYSSPPAYHVGQKVEMLYNPADPDSAQINNFWELWILPIVFIPIAVIGGLVCTLIFAVQLFQWLQSSRAVI